MARVLIVDDNPLDRERTRRSLGENHRAFEVGTADDAIRMSESTELDCAIVAYRLPDRDGLELVGELVERGLGVIMLTDRGDEYVAVEAMKRGAYDYLLKRGLSAMALPRSVERALENRRLREESEARPQELEKRVEELARRRAELEAAHRKLAESKAELQLILRQLPATVWTTDTSLRYTSSNGSRKVADVSQLQSVGGEVGRNLDDEDRETFIQVHRRALAGQAAECEFKVRGYTFQAWVEPLHDSDGSIIGTIGAALDVTNTRELESQLRHSQKMEALGKLAGGVAHDFNNILTAIFSFATFAREAVPPGGPVADDLEQVLEAAQRGATLVKQLLAFSRHRPVEVQTVDVNQVIKGVVPLLRPLLGADVELALDCKSTWETRIDPGGLEQIIMNMAVNARDAMPRGGRISISTQDVSFEEALPTGRRHGLPAGRYVVLAISDEGSGIDAETIEHIFEPFFTTKKVGDGTGLGLATCWGIAQQMGGSISVYSEPGSGTTFKIYLPRHAKQDEDRLDVNDPLMAVAGTEVVLVVEDDPQVRALTVRALRQHGYEVLEAGSLDEARACVESRGESVHLVLADVVMPGRSGPEIVEELREILPNARVLYMSGYTGLAVRQRGLLEQGVPILEKPFTPEMIARKVREVLDGPRRAAQEAVDE